MRHKSITSVLLCSVLLLGGCESLDYTPPTQLSSETFWKTEEDETIVVFRYGIHVRNVHGFGGWC